MNRPINGNPADKDLLEMFQRFLEISFLVSACHHDALEYAALCRDIPEEIRRLKAFAELAENKPAPKWHRVQ